MAEGALGGVIGGFHAFVVDKGPEPFAMGVKLVAHADEAVVPGEYAAQQQRIHLGTNRDHAALKGLPGDFAGTIVSPMLEHQFDLAHQVMPKTFDLRIGVIN